MDTSAHIKASPAEMRGPGTTMDTYSSNIVHAASCLFFSRTVVLHAIGMRKQRLKKEECPHLVLGLDALFVLPELGLSFVSTSAGQLCVVLLEGRDLILADAKV